MTDAEFKAVVTYVGESNIIGIGFDNSAGITFLPPNDPEATDDEGAFSLSRFYIDSIKCFKIPCFDIKGNLYYTYKHVENVQCVMTTNGTIPKTKYDAVNIRG